MLTIKPDQMAALETQALERFFLRVCAFLREIARDDLAKLDDAELLAFVNAGHRSATRYGIAGEQGIVKWLCLQLMAGERFYERPEIDALLKAGSEPELRLDQLYDRLAVLEIRYKGRR